MGHLDTVIICIKVLIWLVPLTFLANTIIRDVCRKCYASNTTWTILLLFDPYTTTRLGGDKTSNYDGFQN